MYVKKDESHLMLFQMILLQPISPYQSFHFYHKIERSPFFELQSESSNPRSLSAIFGLISECFFQRFFWHHSASLKHNRTDMARSSAADGKLPERSSFGFFIIMVIRPDQPFHHTGGPKV
jgi:hypothetical protein